MSKILTLPFIIALLLACLISETSLALELSGYTGLQGRLFFENPLYKEQKHHDLSVFFQPEIYHDLNGFRITFTPFARLDSADANRSHADIRELIFLFFTNDWEFEIGIGKVFWGVTESQHLVDIINQTDNVEAIDGEDKLGQPMAHLSVPYDWGTLEFFIMPYFRERAFPGLNSRLRSPFKIKTCCAVYSSPLEQRQPDAAIRYSHSIDNLEIGLSHFYGTGREPSFITQEDNSGNTVLLPFYEVINQTGLALQLVADSMLLKLETIYRIGQKDKNYYALTSGFEYSLPATITKDMDISLLSEWLYDQRRTSSSNPFFNDILVGTRVAVNDVQGTEALLGVIHNIENGSRSVRLESSRRITDKLKIELELLFVFPPDKDNILGSLKKDSNANIELFYYLP